MPSTLKILLLSILYALGATTVANCQQNIPSASWEKLQNGIAVAVTLNGTLVTAYVNNTSSSPLKIVGDDRHLVRFFYIDANHEITPLRDRLDVNVYASRKVAGSAILPSGGQSPFHQQIDISPDELAAIQTCPVACRFIVLNPSTQQYYNVESTPKVLRSGL